MVKPLGTYLILILALLTSVAGQAHAWNPLPGEAVSRTGTSAADTEIGVPLPGAPEHQPEIFEVEEEEEEEVAADELDPVRLLVATNFNLRALIRFFGQAHPPTIWSDILPGISSAERLVWFQVFRI